MQTAKQRYETQVRMYRRFEEFNREHGDAMTEKYWRARRQRAEQQLKRVVR